ncbi:MAG: family 20 glycosylhydrolase [Armatimonadetes bacterium]|nr:family 20 glycosylhydrolase [Armatimonadota bacterium]
MSVLAAALVIASISPAVNVIPRPYEMNVSGPGVFALSAGTKLVNEDNSPAAEDFRAMVKRSCGFALTGRGSTKVVFRTKSDTRVKLRPDWYWLTVTPKVVTVEYSNETGAFYAVQTLRQLLPTAIESNSPAKGTKWTLPLVQIADGPRFPWRGMLLDCSRHFWSVDYVKKTLDRLAMMKMNVFHWHLVDDGGWRMEVKKYPNLTKMGAWRVDTGEVWPGGGWNFGNLQFCGENGAKKYGGYYSQTQIREIVKYAADRHITIVPEIELPGHSLAAVVSYPELMCENVPPADKPGKSASNVYCAGSDTSIKFLEDVLTETMDLFPSKFIHIGADEVSKTAWHNCPRCQARIKAEGLKDENELQSWVVRHFDKFLANHGRRLVGWDEILEGGLAPGATVMSWRGTEGGIQAAKQDKDVVMCPTSHCYFDYPYTTTSTETVYSYDPVPAELDYQQSQHVLGGQYNVWTEWIPTESRCEELQFPRALAMAEVLWSAKERKDWPDFSRRLAAFMPRFDLLGINYVLPVPRVPFTTLFFTGSTEVKCEAPAGVPQTLRYTLDGTAPSAKSPTYKNPIKVDRACTVTFAYVNKQGVAGQVARVDCRPFVAQAVSLTPGVLVEKYLLSGEPTTIPDLTTMKPTETMAASGLSEDARPRATKFAVRWTGHIQIAKAGAYTFSLTSDDGSRLWVGGALVVDNDGPHGAVTKSGTAWLPAGTYTFEARWYDQGGANSFKAEMSGPGMAKGSFRVFR